MSLLCCLLAAQVKAPTTEVGNDVPVAMVVAPNGDLFVTGYSKIGNSGYDYETIKYNALGVLEWNRRYDGPSDGDDRPAAIGLDANENVYVTGSSAGTGTGADFLTLKYDSKGALQWTKRLDGAGNGDDHPTAMKVTASGDVWVTGYSQSKGTGIDCLTVRYAPDGTEKWIKVYNGPTSGDDFGNAVSVDASDNCYVAGYSRRSRQNSDYLVLSYDPNGKERWVANYGLDRKQDARAVSLTITTSRNICVTGYAEGGHADSDIVTVAYDSDGKQLWTHRYDGPGHGQDKPTGIYAGATGEVVIGSSSGSAGAGLDYAVFCLDANGKLRWQNRYNGAGSGDDIPTSAALSKDGAIFVTGYSQGIDSGSDILTLGLGPSGGPLWTQRFNGAGNDVDRSIGVGLDAAGDVYVAGYSWVGHGSRFEYVSLKYSPQGTLLWKREFQSSTK